MIAVLAAAVVTLALALGSVQAASDAIFNRAGSRFSLPAHLPARLGTNLYGSIERFAPAPYVEAMLARAALDRGDLKSARRHALLLPSSPARSELLGRVAQALGERESAQRYFLAADDVFAIQREVAALRARDPAAAYALDNRMVKRLQKSATHLDALAEAYWMLGQLSTDLGFENPAARVQWFQKGMADYRSAIALSPLSEKYLLAAGIQALNLHDPSLARRYFRSAVSVDPASGDAYAGLGTAALRLGEPQAARAYAAQSRALNPHARFLHDLQHALP